MSAVDMVRAGERFYTSLGFAPLPQTFWDRSLFVKPRDRDVVCHASAWDVDLVERPAHQDVHRSECRRLRDDSPRARTQLLSARLQDAAGAVPRERERRLSRGRWRHDCTVGDAGIPGASRSARPGAAGSRRISVCSSRGRSKRWQSCRLPCWSTSGDGGVFSGADFAGPLQHGMVGAEAAVPRRRAAFASRRRVLRSWREISRRAGTSYTRYFLASILQFQFHRALSMRPGAGCRCRCSIYESREAGRRLQSMIALGKSGRGRRRCSC